MRYFVLWLSGLVMLGWTVSAQQIPVSTIFMENPFAFNPAVAGTDNGFKIRMDNRIQWLGFTDAPFTNLISAYGPHQSRNIGYGGNIMVDQTGPVSMFKGNGAFATNFAINFDIRVSFALNLGFIQYRTNGGQFILYAPEPELNAVMSSFRPDAGVGIYVYHYDWYIGMSAQQLFNNNLKLTPKGQDNKLNRLKTHFYGYGGYRFTMVNKFVIEPSVLMRKVVSLPFQMDLCGKVIYNDQIWGGLSARNTFSSFDDLSLIFGYIHDHKILISIAYDYSFAKIGKFTAGTIELTLGYNFTNIRKGR